MKNNTNTQRQLAMKSLVLAMAGAGLLSLPQHVLANPTGGQVVAGNVTIRQESATKVGITQTTDKGIIDWQKFSIGANEHVQFYQPSASSVTLNRVVGQDPSQILGRLTANGQIFLVNPNGIFFGKNAQIDVAGLVASTHNIRNEDFLAGRYNFNIPGKPGAAVINEGSIRIADTGIAAFVAPSVANRGVIVARLGKVALAAANGFTLDFHGDQLLSFLVSDEVAKTAFDLEGQQLTSFVENSGRIEAQGGYVLLTAKAAESAIHGVINHSGVIEATTVGTQKGEIILHAGKGSLEVSGTLDASAPNGGDGGFIDTSGAQVSIAANTRVNTGALSGKNGLWLIDPLDITINGSMAQAIISALSHGDVTVTTSGNNTPSTVAGEVNGNGDVFVNGAIGWSANKFTLFAHRNIYFNNSLSGTGTAQLALQYGQGSSNGAGSDYFLNNGAKINLPAGDNFSTKQGASGIVKNYTVITSLGSQGSVTATDLQGMNGNLSKNYVLGDDIDASATRSWNGGAGFKPIGQLANTYTGTFDGLGHVIRNLYINRPNEIEVGLIGSMTNSTVRNIGLVDVDVTAGVLLGGLVGTMRWGSSLKSVFATGAVTAVGDPSGGGDTGMAGGLVGFATPYYYGGHTWCGSCINIDTSYANVSVLGGNQIGGLVGIMDQTNVRNSYATGDVTSRLSGASYAGGLVGYPFSSSVVNSYATGYVQGGSSNVGGLIGRSGSVTNSFWDTQTTGRPNSLGGTGKTTAQMQQQATYTGWDFVNTWVMSPGGYPVLRNSPSLTSVVTPPVTPAPSSNTRQILSATYVPPDAGQYAARVASAIYVVPKSPVVDNGNVFDQFKSEKIGVAPVNNRVPIYSDFDYSNMSDGQLNELLVMVRASPDWHPLSNQSKNTYNKRIDLFRDEQIKSMEENQSFMSSKKDMALLLLGGLQGALSTATGLVPTAGLSSSTTRKALAYLKIFGENDKLMRLLDVGSSVIDLDTSNIIRSLMFGTMQFSALPFEDVQKVAEGLYKLADAGYQSGVMSNDFILKTSSIVSDIIGEFQPPGALKVALKGYAAVIDTLDLGISAAENTQKIYDQKVKVDFEKYESYIQKTRRMMVVEELKLNNYY